MSRQVPVVLRCTLPIRAGRRQPKDGTGPQKFIGERVTTLRGNPSRQDSGIRR